MAEFGPHFFSTYVDSSTMSPHRVIASATARSRLATIVRLSAADRLPARACVYEGLASCCSQGAFTAVDLLAEQQRLGCVCASAASVLAHERARSDGLAVGALLVAPQVGRALFRMQS